MIIGRRSSLALRLRRAFRGGGPSLFQDAPDCGDLLFIRRGGFAARDPGF